MTKKIIGEIIKVFIFVGGVAGVTFIPYYYGKLATWMLSLDTSFGAPNEFFAAFICWILGVVWFFITWAVVLACVLIWVFIRDVAIGVYKNISEIYEKNIEKHIPEINVGSISKLNKTDLSGALSEPEYKYLEGALSKE